MEEVGLPSENRRDLKIKEKFSPKVISVLNMFMALKKKLKTS